MDWDRGTRTFNVSFKIEMADADFRSTAYKPAARPAAPGQAGNSRIILCLVPAGHDTLPVGSIGSGYGALGFSKCTASLLASQRKAVANFISLTTDCQRLP